MASKYSKNTGKNKALTSTLDVMCHTKTLSEEEKHQASLNNRSNIPTLILKRPEIKYRPNIRRNKLEQLVMAGCLSMLGIYFLPEIIPSDLLSTAKNHSSSNSKCVSKKTKYSSNCSHQEVNSKPMWAFLNSKKSTNGFAFNLRTNKY